MVSPFFVAIYYLNSFSIGVLELYPIASADIYKIQAFGETNDPLNY